MTGTDERRPSFQRGDAACDSGQFAQNAGAAIIGNSPALLAALERVRRSASTDATVLIEGESGTGKELAARAIHYLGARRDEPFICVNCGSLPESLVENELFGHERGAYTDARDATLGLVADAQGGTLFLDEIEAMSQRTQVALLRFLQDGVYRPIGARRSLQSNVRVIAASNVDLHGLARAGKFREDLLYRLRIMIVEMPPLRARGSDLQVLVQHFLRKFANQYRCPPKCLAKSLMAAMQSYDWPGNIRELENLLHRAFLYSNTVEISLEDAGLRARSPSEAAQHPADKEFSLGFSAAKACAIEEFERSYVTWALRRTQGNVSAAARESGKERRAFGKLVKKYGIEKGGAEASQSSPPDLGR